MNTISTEPTGEPKSDKTTERIFNWQVINVPLLREYSLASLLSYLICILLIKFSNVHIYGILFASSCLVALYCFWRWRHKFNPWRAYFSAFVWLLLPTISLVYLDKLKLSQLFSTLTICLLSLYLAAYLGTLIILILERELCFYLFFGALTTVVSVASFTLSARCFSFYPYQSWLGPQTISFVLSILFAFVVNRRYVFLSKGPLIKEFERFVGSRIISSLICEYLLMAVFVDVLSLNWDLSKITTAFMVVLLNYLFSKIFVFRKSRVK